MGTPNLHGSHPFVSAVVLLLSFSGPRGAGALHGHASCLKRRHEGPGGLEGFDVAALLLV